MSHGLGICQVHLSEVRQRRRRARRERFLYLSAMRVLETQAQVREAVGVEQSRLPAGFTIGTAAEAEEDKGG